MATTGTTGHTVCSADVILATDRLQRAVGEVTSQVGLALDAVRDAVDLGHLPSTEAGWCIGAVGQLAAALRTLGVVRERVGELEAVAYDLGERRGLERRRG